MNKCDETEQGISNLLDEFAKAKKTHKKETTYTEWTKSIKKVLANLGVNNDCEVATSGFNGKYENEWLYDLIWYINDEKGNLKNLPLVVESEWSRSFNDIKYDFEKLLVTNAEHWLFICNSKPDQIDELFTYFKNAVKTYSLLNTGSRFLIAIMDDYDTGGFYYDLVIKE